MTGGEGRRERATLGGGCFWCLEPIIDQLRGVERVVPGYAGGRTTNPTYEEVCSGRTGHAEVVQVTYDADRISFRDLLQVFFSVHDPTTRDRQGADVGTQYRSIILYHDEEQKRTAESVIAELEAEDIWPAPIVTEIVPLTGFHEAEEYHRDYYRRNPEQGYCRAVIAPKLAKFRQHHLARLMR